MSYQPLWLRDLVAYSLQAAALVGVGVMMARLLRLRVPRVRMAYWQGLVALCLFLPLLQPWRPEVLETSGTVLSNVTFNASAPAASPTVSLAQIVLLLICTGIIVRAAWMAMGMLRLWLYRREAQRIEVGPEAVAEAQRLVPVSARFFISSRLETPATFGYFRPAILFPSRFLEMEPAMQKAIALHELLHVERRDWLWNLLEETVLSVLWFHLPLWWAVRSIRLSREQVVDAEAVRRGNARRPYLKALLEMAGQKRLAESLPAALFLRESQLAERVALMMKEIQMSRKRVTVSILAAGTTLLITGASLVWAFPLKAPAQTQASAISSAAGETSLPGNSLAPETGSTRKGEKIYKVGDGVQAPVPIYKPEPPYTPQARKAKYQGTCVLWIIVDAQGNVTNAQIVKPLGMGLDENALTTVKTWKFKPATRKGVPVAVRIMIQLSFRLYGKHDKPSAKSDPRPDPASDPQPQAEIQRQVDKATKKALIAEQEAAKIDQARIQRQMQKQMEQLRKLNTPEMRAQMKKQMEQLAKLNTPEMRRQMQEQMKQLKKLNTPEMRQRMQEAMKQAEKVNTPQMRKQLEKVMKQAQLDQAQAEKTRSSEAQKQLKQARKELRATQKQLEKARKQLRKQQLELKKQDKQVKPPEPPTTSPPPPPVQGSSQKMSPPPPPPASPPPPPPPHK